MVWLLVQTFTGALARTSPCDFLCGLGLLTTWWLHSRRNIQERAPGRSHRTFYDLTSSHRASFMLHPVIQGGHWDLPRSKGRGLVFTSCCRRAYGFSYICCDHLWKISVTAGLSEWQKASLNCFPERGAHHRWARWYSSFWGQMSGLGLERQKRGPAEDWGHLLAIRSYWKQWG